MKNLTVRNLPPAVADALKREKSRRGTSLNQTVIDLLEQSLGVSGVRSNGLGQFAGRWNEAEFERFSRAVTDFAATDPELWG